MDEAIAQQREAVRLEPHNSNYQGDLGNLLYNAGKYGEAEATYRERLKLEPDDAMLHANLATVLFSLKRNDEAVEEGKRAIALGLNKHPVFKALGLTP